jgi:shikimate kinase
VKQHLVLVGLPGAGKTTVGRLVAHDLGTELHDIDQAIERKLGTTISEVFAAHGEVEFRDQEREETERALDGQPAVIVPGGGWAAQPGNLEVVSTKATTVYLETSPATAHARVAIGDTRPLLSGPDSALQLEALYAARRAYYERCSVTVSTEGKTPTDVAKEVIQLALSGEGQ